MCGAPANDCLLASRAFKQDLDMLSVQMVCDHILSNVYTFHHSQQMYFQQVLYIIQQCVSKYCTSGQPHHMPLPAVAAFPGILNIFPATNICKIFATNICHRSGFTPKFCTKCLKKLKNSWGSSKHFNISNHSPFILSSP